MPAPEDHRNRPEWLAIFQNAPLMMALLEQTGDGIFILDTTGKLLWVNPSFAEMHGFTVEEMLQKGLEDLDVDGMAHVAERIGRVLGGETLSFDVEHHHRDGRTLPLSVTANLVSSGDERLIMAIHRDIGERKQFEKALQESEALLARSQAIAHVGSWILDNVTNELTWSDEVFRIFGIEPQAFGATYEAFLDMVHPEDRLMVKEAYAGSLREGKDSYDLEHRIVRRDTGETRHVHERCIREYDGTGKIVRSIGMVQDITERKRNEEAQRHSHELMSHIIRYNRSAIAVHDREMRYLFVSQRYLEDYQVKEADVIGRHHYEIFPDLPQKWRDVHQKALAGAVISAEDDPYYREDGTVDWTRWECRPWYEADGTIGGIIVYTEVINERKKAEQDRERLQAQLTQAQKMESVGRLAGGVAHDFNNMLGVIFGHLELALERLDPAQPIHADLQGIKKAAERSADLTRQLLAFARKQTIAPKVLDLNEVVETMLQMLRRIIGEDIDLIWRPGRALSPVKVDPSQIDQVLVNLAVNARDAIAGVGKMTIETDNVAFDAEYCARHAGFMPGDYVLLAVSDDGCGMDKEVQGKLFEPFFTTKETGKGTGLGMAMIYGIVKQNGGFINLYSEPGEGTTFKIYLPRYQGSAAKAPPAFSDETAEGGKETILLVEDEPEMLGIIILLLERQGYTVLPASTPGEAIALAEGHDGPIDLLMTDVVMPEMNGRELARTLLSLYPRLRRLFMSGYTANVIAHHGVLDEGVNFIQKPFSIGSLAAKVREVLDKP